MLSTGNGLSAADIAAVTGNNGFGFGGEGSLFYLLILFLFAGGFNGGWGNGYGNNNGGGYLGAALSDGVVPWMINQNTNDGFNQQAITGALSGLQASVTSGFGDVALGLANVNQGVCNGFAQAESSANARQIAGMQQDYSNTIAMLNGFNGVSQQLANNQANFNQCCCDQKAATADLKYTVATEACADRNAVSMGVRDILSADTANTQLLLTTINNGIQSIKDEMCQDRYNAVSRENDNLRQQLNTAQMQSFINAQTGVLMNDNAAQTQAVENYIRPQVNPCYVVPNPYCSCNN